MPKKFFTDTDIEELHRKGIKSLRMSDDIVLTDLAYEKAKRLNIQLIFDHADNRPAAPLRPYLSDKEPPRAKPITASVHQPFLSPSRSKLLLLISKNGFVPLCSQSLAIKWMLNYLITSFI